jgi:hypothetical protein
VARKDNTPQDASLDPDLHRGTPDPCAYSLELPRRHVRSLGWASGPFE